jgi:alkylation response protein AidB-like acyl-CoA dehydrogenase
MNDDDHELLEYAVAIAPTLAAQSVSIERERRIPQCVADELADLGMFRMLVPRDLGGFEVHPATMVRVLATLAQGDAACAWHVMTGATNGVLSAYLPHDTATAVWADNPTVIMAGVFAPAGRATPVDGGYQLSGRWPFASGCDNASWLMGGGLVMGEHGTRLLENGKPEIRSFLFPAAEVKIEDTWDVAGLCGTGSHHIAVDSITVPSDHTCCLLSDAPQHDGALYRFPVFGLLAAGVAAVGLGIARAAIDACTQLAKDDKRGARKLAEQELMQHELAKAEGELRSGEALLLRTCDDTFRVARVGELALRQRALLRLAATQATRHAVRAVDAMYQAGGGTALYRSSSLQRHFRDVHAVTQHIMVSAHTDKTVGRVLLDVPTDVSQL